jgi:hypothetical protein
VIETLTAEQLRALHAKARNEDTKRAIRRRLSELDNQPPAPKQVGLQPGWERRVMQRLPPRTRTWWPLEDIATAVETERRGTP